MRPYHPDSSLIPGTASRRSASGQMTGNPVKLRDGCATVTGYKFPLPLIHPDREGGNEV